MIRGTTPTITMKLPNTVNVDNIASAIVSIEQSGKEVIKKTTSDILKNKDNNSLSIKLSQDETLSLSANNKAILQLKIKTFTETVIASLPRSLVIRDVINEEVM